MNDDDLAKLEQNAFRDTMKDGLVELLGGTMLLFAPIMAFQSSFIIIFIIFYIILLPQAIERARQKYTYPRIGYVKLRIKESDTNPKPFLLLLVISILATGIVTFLLTDDVFNLYNWVSMLPFLFGMIMFAPSAYLVEKSGSKKYWLLGLITSISGFIIAYLTSVYPTTDVYEGILAFCMLMGISLIVGGLVRFLYFLRTYPILDSQEDAVSEQ